MAKLRGGSTVGGFLIESTKGSTEKINALKVLMDGKVNKFTPEDGVDLNTLLTPGEYVITGTTLDINKPVTNYGFLTVGATGGYIKQTYITDNDNRYFTRHRPKNVDTWTAWLELQLFGTIYTLPASTASVLGGVKVGTNINVSAGTISVNNGSTTVKGVVQLTDGVASTSTTTAATPNSIKTVNDSLNTFIGRRDNPHAVTTTQVNRLADYSYKMSDSYDKYPLGISIMFVGSVAAEGEWLAYGTVTTIRSYGSGGSTLQIYTPYNDTLGGPSLKYRTWKYQSTTWSAWNDYETSAGAQSKVNTHASNTTLHITAAERTAWNDKASTASVTTTVNGLMIAADKVKLNGIAANANNYVLPTATTAVLGGVKNGANINNSAGVLSVNDGTTAVKGVLQLTDGVASASTTTAATPNAVKTVNDSLNTFIGRRDNPHVVTKQQVGLGSLSNFATATTDQGVAGTSESLFMTPLAVKKAIQNYSRAVSISGGDLNTIIEPGYYYFILGPLPANSPFGDSSYFLEVIGNGSAPPIQKAYEVMGTGHAIRSKDVASWNSWKKIISSSDLDIHANNETHIDPDERRLWDRAMSLTDIISDDLTTQRPPAWYLSTYPALVLNEVKTAASISLPWVTGTDLVSLRTEVPWTATKGGKVYQEVIAGGKHFYRGTVNGNWTTWYATGALNSVSVSTISLNAYWTPGTFAFAAIGSGGPPEYSDPGVLTVRVVEDFCIQTIHGLGMIFERHGVISSAGWGGWVKTLNSGNITEVIRSSTGAFTTSNLKPGSFGFVI